MLTTGKSHVALTYIFKNVFFFLQYYFINSLQTHAFKKHIISITCLNGLLIGKLAAKFYGIVLNKIQH